MPDDINVHRRLLADAQVKRDNMIRLLTAYKENGLGPFNRLLVECLIYLIRRDALHNA